MNNDNELDQYLFFSSSDLIHYFVNNLADKDFRTQSKRIFEMARVYMDMKEFTLEDIYSLVIMIKDINYYNTICEVLRLYFRPDKYPVGIIIIEPDEMEETADIEIEFSAYKGNKVFIQSTENEVQPSPFSQAVMLDKYVHSSGISSMNPDITEGINECLDNIKKMLRDVGSSIDNVYSFIIYTENLDHLPELDKVFADENLTKDNTLLEILKVQRFINDKQLEISYSATVHS